MTSTISGKEWAIGDLFGREFVFRIPPYQRPYAWEEEQAGTLFSDLDTALGATTQEKLEQTPPYFLGSVVVIKGESGPDADLVDGQQRLTTLTILLSVLRSEVDDPELKSQLRDLIYEPENKLRRTPARYRLSLRERDREFFQNYIQVDDGLAGLKSLNLEQLSDAKRNFARNALLLAKRVRELSLERRVLLAQYLVARCFLVVVSTPTFDSAYRIFSVLNDRGMDLGLPDVLKAEVLGAIIREDERDSYASKWEETEEELGREAFGELFAHIRTIAVYKKPETTVMAELRSFVKPAAAPKQFIDDVLVKYSSALGTIRQANYQSAEDATTVNGLFRWLNRIDNRDWEPVAIRLVERHQASLEALERTVGALERLASILMVSRADVNDRINRYAPILAALAQSNASPESIIGMLAPTTTERDDGIEVVDGPLYENAKVRAYVLLRIDALLSGAKAPHVRENPTVEHVLPQNPEAGSEWLTWWPDDKERGQWVHRLGNLLLLTQRKNSQASRLEFDDKKRKYFQTRGGVADFPLTSQVLVENSWTPQVVARRQTELVKLLQRHWAGA
jgi:hypothetical protein